MALQWQHDHSTKIGRHPPPQTIAHYKWHPALAPRPLHQNWSSPSNGTLQWHHDRSTKIGRHPLPPNHSTTTTPPKLVVTLRPTIAHYNGTLQWHHDHSTKNWSSPSAPSHSTLQWHPAVVPSRPIRQSGSSASPLLEVRTPIAIAIWGITRHRIALH